MMTSSRFHVLTVDGMNRIKATLAQANPGSIDLDLWHCSLQDWQLSELQPFFAKLRSLDIGDNSSLSTQAVAGFCQLLKDPFNAPRGLESLCLSRLPISDAAIIALSESLGQRAIGLKELYLRDCGITDGQFHVLLQGIQNQPEHCQLKLLNCRQNRLTGKAAKIVQDAVFKAPIKIDLRQNPIPEAVLERLHVVLKQQNLYYGMLDLQTDVFSLKAITQPAIITAPSQELFKQVFQQPPQIEADVVNTCVPQQSTYQNTVFQDNFSLPQPPALINPIGISVKNIYPGAYEDPLQAFAARFDQPANTSHQPLQVEPEESFEQKRKRARHNIFRQTEPRPVGPTLNTQQQIPNLWLERQVQGIESKVMIGKGPSAVVQSQRDFNVSSYQPVPEIVIAKQSPPSKQPEQKKEAPIEAPSQPAQLIAMNSVLNMPQAQVTPQYNAQYISTPQAPYTAVGAVQNDGSLKPTQGNMGVDLSALFGSLRPPQPPTQPLAQTQANAQTGDLATKETIRDLHRQIDGLREEFQAMQEEDVIFQQSFLRLKPILEAKGMKITSEAPYKAQIIEVLTQIAFPNTQ